MYARKEEGPHELRRSETGTGLIYAHTSTGKDQANRLGGWGLTLSCAWERLEGQSSLEA